MNLLELRLYGTINKPIMRKYHSHLIFTFILLALSGSMSFAQEAKTINKVMEAAPARAEDSKDKFKEIEEREQLDLDLEESRKVQATITSKNVAIDEISRNQRSSNFYGQQSDAWNQQIQQQRQDANGWLNYYKSERYSNYSSTEKKITPAQQQELDNIVNEMGTAVPGTFEYHYVKFWNSNYSTSEFNHLEEAYKVAPNKVELYDDFIGYYETTFNESKKKEFCQKWYNSKDIPTAVMNYNYNVLMSVAPNGILITNGEYDTYPIWIWQQVKNIRKDITVLNADLLGVEHYRKQKLSKLGLKQNTSYTDRHRFFKELAAKNPNKPIYFGLTVPPQTLKPMKDNLYVTGLAFRYSSNRIDNIAMLKSNWERKFNKGYLNTANKGANSTVKKLNSNYLAPLLMLEKEYQKTGETTKAKEVKATAVQLAKESGKDKQVNKYLKK